MTPRNIHPVDELAEIRDKLKLLKAREEEIREKILSGEASLTGDIFKAVVSESSRDFLRAAEVISVFGRERLHPFLTTASVSTIRVTPRRRDDE